MDVSVLGAADPPTSTPISTSTSNIDAHAAAISGVTVFLFEGKRFAVSDEPGGNPFCEFTLGRENYRSYTAAGTEIDPENPQWMEEFDLFLHDPRQLQLHVTVCNSRLAGTKSDVIGKGVVDLTKLEFGKSEEIWLDVMTSSQEVAGSLHLSFTLGKRLLTINTLKDGLLPEHILMQQIYLREKFHPLNTLRMAADSDVGVLIVKILRAKDIMPDRTNRDKTVVCSAQLVNARLDTFARTGTSDPEWNCVFTFPVRDVHTDLFISLWCPGVDGRARKDFLGGTAVRLTEIENGKPRWSALKDKNLRTDVGGSVLVNASLIYNPIAAAMKSIGRKEARFGREEKQTISLKSFSYDVQRVKNVVAPLVDLGRTARLILNWESPPITIISFVIYMLIVWYIQIWMIPLCLLICLLANKRVRHTSKTLPHIANQMIDDLGEKPDDDVDSPGFFTKVFVDIPDAALHIQSLLRFAVDLYERLINILQFNEPWLATCLAVVLGAATLLTYLVPFRVLMILLGIHKFTKKIRNPNSIPHNDVVAFLSRARTNDKLRVHAELASQSLLQTSSRPSSSSNASNNSGGSNGTFVESTGRLERNDHAHRQRSSSWNLVGVEKMMKF